MPLLVVLIYVFILGAVIGSLLNVCICRIPLEKSIIWPGSFCWKCVQPIRWYDNIPLISYWVLRGRCRTCGESFSIRYFFVELLTAMGFTGLFYLEAILNIHDLPAFRHLHDGETVEAFTRISLLQIPFVGWGFVIFHWILLSYLIVVSFCDIDTLTIPFSITVAGTLVGLAGGAILWGFMPASAEVTTNPLGLPSMPKIATGVYPWPVWSDPLPSWLARPSWWTGLATGLAGTLAGMMVLRGVRFVFQLGRGIEGMGIGDADVMMMAGSFLGWQAVVLAFFVGVFVALFFGIAQLIRRGNQMMPFGPALAIGVLVTMICWERIGPRFAPIMFDGTVMTFMLVAGTILLLLISFGIRVIRR